MSDIEFTEHWTADRARRKQTALTKLSNGLQKEVLGCAVSRELFTPEELKAMETASLALRNAKQKFAHLKEKKARVEKRKAQELAAIDQQTRKYANQVLNDLNPDTDTFTREQFCLWVTVARRTRNLMEPERWELDVNDNMDNHYHESDHAYRQQHVWMMRDKAQKTLEDSLKRAWEFSFEKDAWVVRVPIKEAVEQIKSLLEHDEYQKVETQYSTLIEALETYNREVVARRVRKTIKSV